MLPQRLQGLFPENIPHKSSKYAIKCAGSQSVGWLVGLVGCLDAEHKRMLTVGVALQRKMGNADLT